MARAKKMVPIKIPDDFLSNEITLEWGGVELSVLRTLPLADVVEFVANVTESCFGSDGSYNPEIIDFAIKANVATKYANIKLPKDIKKQYELLYISKVCDAIVKVINVDQFEEILTAINRKIKYNVDSRVKQAHAEIQKIADGFAATQERLTEAMMNLSGIDMQELLEKFESFDEKDFAREYARAQLELVEKPVPSIGENESIGD